MWIRMEWFVQWISSEILRAVKYGKCESEMWGWKQGYCSKFYTWNHQTLASGLPSIYPLPLRWETGGFISGECSCLSPTPPHTPQKSPKYSTSSQPLQYHTLRHDYEASHVRWECSSMKEGSQFKWEKDDSRRNIDKTGVSKAFPSLQIKTLSSEKKWLFL